MSEYDFKSGQTREEKIDKFLDNLAWHFFVRKTGMDPTAIQVRTLNEKLDVLNENIKKADESSTKLTSALNRITLAGAIIAGLGILIAGLSFVFEYLIK